MVELMVRPGCGSCLRVEQQIRPIVADAGAQLRVVDVTASAGGELAVEFGDRVPVVVIDGEEFSCWEVDSEELAEELAAGGAEAQRRLT
ncbi:Glutaredoxin-like domain (DUF836) [Corynebacterium uterequi]|uniref:Glutaredoxin-like domain (DUF836) n=1 Tax=Corynebacterium uterequi TaxID=1072256 RepID=A0A0G3HA79_9CORY|nr:Glutaredoxin-like domain (DUF836) [Corynebacterium uterequi]